MLIKKKKILVLGQTPPPYGGQALMIQTLLDGEYESADLVHVRLDFSKNFDDMGSFKLYKFWALFKAIFLTWVYRFYYQANILYYGPAGPNKMAMYRDVILLFTTRFIFKKTILHTHAGGSSKLYDRLNAIEKFFYRGAFFEPDGLITLTDFSHGDDIVLKPKKVFVVPNGIKDEFPEHEEKKQAIKNNTINLLYVGAMYPERGIVELVDAVKLVSDRNIPVHLNLMGIFISSEFEAEIVALLKKHGIENQVTFLGTKVGEAKWDVFCNTDIFCFPTYVPSETFGLVLVESMQFEIPVIATRWNGIPLVFEEGVDGMLVNIKDAQDMASKIEILATNETLRTELGANGRKKYLERYSISTFRTNMDKVFKEI